MAQEFSFSNHGPGKHQGIHQPRIHEHPKTASSSSQLLIQIRLSRPLMAWTSWTLILAGWSADRLVERRSLGFRDQSHRSRPPWRSGRRWHRPARIAASSHGSKELRQFSMARATPPTASKVMPANWGLSPSSLQRATPSLAPCSAAWRRRGAVVAVRFAAEGCRVGAQHGGGDHRQPPLLSGLRPGLSSLGPGWPAPGQTWQQGAIPPVHAALQRGTVVLEHAAR